MARTPITTDRRAVRAVLFDYGHTLVDIRWTDDTLLGGERALLAALGAPAELADEFHARVRAGRIGAEQRAAPEGREIDYLEVTRAALAQVGVRPSQADLEAGMRAQLRAWDPVRHIHPDAIELLQRLRAAGILIGYVSNTFDPPAMLEETMALDGLLDLADAVVLSSALGFRKPSPRIYRAAVEAVRTAPQNTLFVGDRVLEDIAGPRREGMQTALATWFRHDSGDHALADHVPARPLDILHLAGVRG